MKALTGLVRAPAALTAPGDLLCGTVTADSQGGMVGSTLLAHQPTHNTSGQGGPTMKALARLVRAPAALTVPGDVLCGAVAADSRGGVVGKAVSSVLLYWSGMALNDYVDRHIDAVERPDRPIPSGAVSPRAALGVAAGLTGASLAVAAVVGGRRHLCTRAIPLAAAVWAYDLALKKTAAGPVAMAVARFLDVLSGADRVRAALPAAALVGLHTLAVTRLSLHEVHGGNAAAPRAALVTTAAVGAGAVRGGVFSAGAGACYLAVCAPAQVSAVREPTAGRVRRAVGVGIHGLIPLQAALIARKRPALAVPVAALLPLARRLGRRVSPT